MNVNVLPFSGVDATRMLPPCISTSFLPKARPRPVPSCRGGWGRPPARALRRCEPDPPRGSRSRFPRRVSRCNRGCRRLVEPSIGQLVLTSRPTEETGVLDGGRGVRGERLQQLDRLGEDRPATLLVIGGEHPYGEASSLHLACDPGQAGLGDALKKRHGLEEAGEFLHPWGTSPRRHLLASPKATVTRTAALGPRRTGGARPPWRRLSGLLLSHEPHFSFEQGAQAP